MDIQIKVENNETSIIELAKLIKRSYHHKLSGLGLDMRVTPQKGNDENFRLQCLIERKNGRTGCYPEFVCSLTVFFLSRPMMYFKSKTKHGTCNLERASTLFTTIDLLVNDHVIKN